MWLVHQSCNTLASCHPRFYSRNWVVEIGEEMGCLEVKCPYVCKTKQIAVAELASYFCLQIKNGTLHLKKKHQYFYQVQTQLFVTKLPWCDFVLWAANDDIYVEQIFYDDSFIDDAVSKARTFYFDIFLPSIVPHVIIADSCEANRSAILTTEIVDTQICGSIEICDNVQVLDNSKASIDAEVEIVKILSSSTLGNPP